MPKICYVPRQMTPGSLRIVEQANEIIETYQQQGYRLTLRQLYYQFVSRDLIANKVSEYKRLGSIINDARLAGLIDWDSIEDRTRSLSSIPHWGSPAEIVNACAQQYRIDKWAKQPHRVEVWVEKEALAGVFERACRDLDVPFLSCRGYTSQSEMWGASMRLRTFVKGGQDVVILHFGDHDPSGIDMSRDIRDRLQTFGLLFDMKRIALNMDQVEQYQPPPNPAKETDARFQGYIAEYGHESWELDALEPKVLASLVQREIKALLDRDAWDAAVASEERQRSTLEKASDQWSDVVSYIGADDEEE